MKQIIMWACSLIVLCLTNISIGCKPNVDKNSDGNGNGNSNGNLIPFENYKRDRIGTPNFEATIYGDNGQLDANQDLVDTDCETDCPYKGYDSGSGVIGESSNNGDTALPQAEIHIQHYNQVPGHIHHLPRSVYNTGAGDNGRLINFNKVTAYPSGGYSGSGSYNGGPSGNTNNYYNLHYSDKVKPYKSGGYYKKGLGKREGLAWYDDIFFNGIGKKGRYPSSDKSKPYTSANYYAKGSNLGKFQTGLLPKYQKLINREGDKYSTYTLPDPNLDLSRAAEELDIKTYSTPKLPEFPDVNEPPSIGEKADSNEYENLARPVCSQCESYQDSYTYPKSKSVLRQIYEFGLG